MKYKVSELEGAALDAAVACAEGMPCMRGLIVNGVERVTLCEADGFWCPSTDWAQGGPILDRERITTDDLVEGLRTYVASRFGDEVEIPRPTGLA